MFIFATSSKLSESVSIDGYWWRQNIVLSIAHDESSSLHQTRLIVFKSAPTAAHITIVFTNNSALWDGVTTSTDGQWWRQNSSSAITQWKQLIVPSSAGLVVKTLGLALWFRDMTPHVGRSDRALDAFQSLDNGFGVTHRSTIGFDNVVVINES